MGVSRGLGTFGVFSVVAIGTFCVWAPISRGVAAKQMGDSGQAPIPVTAKSIPPAKAYAGDASCAVCHRAEAATYATTAHRFTSSLPTAATIEGSFVGPSNLMRTSVPTLGFLMTANHDGAAGDEFFQSAIDISDPDHPRRHTEQFDIVVGSGRKARTYLYWKDDLLFELPVSYWKETQEWINSPGYPDGHVRFDKPIVPRCLDCHGSYFESLSGAGDSSGPVNRFRRDSLVLGITCEKCHGPAAEHVAREQAANPPGNASPGKDSGKSSGKDSLGLAIVSLSHLSRDRQVDQCALCHAGAATPIAPVLSFLPGEKIDDYLQIHDPGPDASVDVHGNQVLLLRRSRCFQSSQMSCSTCHNVHQPQRDVAAFSERCLGCHQVKACGKFASMGESIRTRCIDCHMPLQKSDVLFSDTGGRRLNPLVRNHRIAVYAEVKTAEPVASR